MEAVPRAPQAVYFIKNVEMWSAGCRRHLGMEKCLAWLILCITKQGSSDSEVNWFLLAFTGFVNEYLNTLHQSV